MDKQRLEDKLSDFNKLTGNTHTLGSSGAYWYLYIRSDQGRVESKSLPCLSKRQLYDWMKTYMEGFDAGYRKGKGRGYDIAWKDFSPNTYPEVGDESARRSL